MNAAELAAPAKAYKPAHGGYCAPQGGSITTLTRNGNPI